MTNALFARAPLRIAAWSGSELDDAGAASVTLATAQESLWQHGAGQPYSQAELSVAVALVTGESLRFVLAERPASWSLDADDPAALRARWDGTAVVVTALRATAFRALEVTTS